LNQVTQQNASSSEELASASTNFNTQAGKLKETVSFFKLDQSTEVLHQRERIINQIEHLKSILGESESSAQMEENVSKKPVIKTNGKSNAKTISVSDSFGGPSIQLDDFDSVSTITEGADAGEKQNGSHK
jgi:methyl-accepting chemotaxis protein